MSDTLVLNATAEPLSIVPLSTLTWQEAIKLIYLERVDVLEWYDNWKVHSPSTDMRVPSVIMLREYLKVSRTVKFSRFNMALRDHFKCQFCGKSFAEHQEDLTMDHVIPRYHGGKTTWDNVVTACQKCNTEKSHHTHMKPMKAPKRPSYQELFDARRHFPVVMGHPTWNNYLSWPDNLVKYRR
jgi:5-methylcytosine-specific restriction endonuclease McrA